MRDSPGGEPRKGGMLAFTTATTTGNDDVTEVGISYELTLLKVNDADEQFMVEIDLKYTWIARGFPEMYRAAGRPPAGTDAFEELVENCWDPRVRIANVADSDEEVSLKTLCLDPGKGRMHRFLKHRIWCSESLELFRFPFDRQLLAIHITSFRDTNEVVFVPYKGRPSQTASRASRWKIKNRKSPLLIIPDPTSKGLVATSGRAYHKCFIVIEAQRDWQWYVIHFILPFFVILIMNANVVLIPRNDVADRCSVTLTLLLTSVAFQYLLVNEVPKKAYFTILDQVLTWGLVLQVLTCIIVFMNADNPHSAGDPMHDRGIFYPLTDENVLIAENIFLYVTIIPWIAYNSVLVAGAFFGVWTRSFTSMIHSEQDWMWQALGVAENEGIKLGEVMSGEYDIYRCAPVLTSEHIQLNNGVATRKVTDPNIMGAPAVASG